jgi:uncharacterized protein
MSEVSIHDAYGARFVDRLHDAFLDGDPGAASKGAEATNVLRLQAQYRALTQGDFAPLLAALADDVELDLQGPAELPINGRWRGLAEVSAAVQRNFGALEQQQAELLSVVAQGDTVVLFGEERGKARASGASYHVRWAQIFTFRGDKVCQVRGVAALVAPSPQG